MSLVHVGGDNWSVQVIVEIDLAIWIRIYRSIRPEMSLGSIRGSLLSSSFSGSSCWACDIYSVMCGKVIGREDTDLIFDCLSFAIDAPFCFVRRQPLLVDEQAQRAIVDCWVLEIAPVIFPFGLARHNQADLGVWAL